MNKMILLVLLFYGFCVTAQPVIKPSDSLKKVYNQNPNSMKPSLPYGMIRSLPKEDEIKADLILLALNNAQAVAADASVRIAMIARRKANSSFLGSVSLGGNVNEFVINNSPAANFFPKYNFGLSIPLDMFAKNKAEKRTANEMIIINSSQKTLIGEALKAKVLIQYETYKEKKELLELQRIITDDDIAAYAKAQKDYKDDIITIDDVNKIYGELIRSRSNLVSKEKDLNIAVIEIEETIGVPLKTVLEKER